MRYSRRFILAVMVGLIGLGSGVLFFATHEEKQKLDASVSSLQLKDAPRFSLPDSSGKLHTLEQQKGKVILIHFWASWCAPCLDELPKWLEMGKQYPDDPVVFIAISLDSNWNDLHKIFPEEKPLSNGLSLIDLSGKVPDLYGTYQYPETYLISPDLKIVTKWVGSQDWGNKDLQNLLKRLFQSAKSHAKSSR